MSAETRGLAGIFFEARDLDAGEVLLLDGCAGSLHHSATAPAAMLVIVDGREPAFRPLDGGGLCLTRALFWSLLWPSRAAEMTTALENSTATLEAFLKWESALFRRRLAWWRRIDSSVRESCARLMSRRVRGMEGVLPTLDRLADSNACSVDHCLDDAEELVREIHGTDRIPPLEIPAAPVDTEDVARWLTDVDSFGRLFGHEFTPRFEQGRLAASVAGALDAGQALLAEAGTGVGKTLAYLLPLLMYRAAGNGRAVISTHTRALQKQILEHDLPVLAPLFPGVRVRLLMGRRNYLCLRARREFLTLSSESARHVWEKVAMHLWLAETEAGLREELTEHPLLAGHLGRLFDHGQPCSPVVCFCSDDCFVQRARKLAREADLIVVNHALLMHDLRAEGALIGTREALVIDEAHRLPGVALDTHAIVCDRRRAGKVEELLGERRSGATMPARLAELTRQLDGGGPESVAAAESVLALAADVITLGHQYDIWWRALSDHFTGSATGPWKKRIRDKDEAFGPVRAVTAAMLQTAAMTSRAFARVAAEAELLEDLSSGAEENLASLAQAGQMVSQLEKDIRFLTGDPDEDWVTWLSLDQHEHLASVGATLLEAGPVLKGYWQSGEPPPIMTSATLAVADDFTHMLNELGLTGRRPRTNCVLLDSPFDYSRQARFLVPTNLPPPPDPGYENALVDVLAAVLPSVPRKAMVLFTSYGSLERVAELLAPVADGGGLFDVTRAGLPEILCQRPGGGALQLLNRFRRADRAVLFGTSTFWEGVDFAGRDLEQLIVTRLPFLVPNDPWVEARCERYKARGENPFTEFMVRDAVLRLRQGVGRLIRRTSDRGVVILLDSRLHAKPYGVTFLNSLPAVSRFCRVGDALTNEIAEFLNES